MKISEFIEEFEREFFARLNQKTGWGKEEVKREFKEVKGVIALRSIEKLLERR